MRRPRFLFLWFLACPCWGAAEAQAQSAQVLVSTRAVDGTYSNSDGRMGVKFSTGSSPITLSHVSLILTRANTNNANTVVTIRDGNRNHTNPTGSS